MKKRTRRTRGYAEKVMTRAKNLENEIIKNNDKCKWCNIFKELGSITCPNCGGKLQ